jgi:putative tricarboxylic transport membrane protein
MSTEAQPTPVAREGGRSELGVAALLLVVGIVVIVNASQLSTNIASTGPVGPAAVPYLVGALLVVVAVLLAINILRGGRGEPEGGEDVDLAGGSDWRTMGLVAIAFLANMALIEPLGWAISGGILFFLAAFALGSRHIIRDLVISAVLSVGTWYLFVLGLGISLPAGILRGIL